MSYIAIFGHNGSYIDNAGREFEDLNLRGQIAINNPIKAIWLAVTHGTGGAKPFFFEDMLRLFAQLSGRAECRRGSYDLCHHQC